jgi:hypothetical protein
LISLYKQFGESEHQDNYVTVSRAGVSNHLQFCGNYVLLALQCSLVLITASEFCCFNSPIFIDYFCKQERTRGHGESQKKLVAEGM